MAFRPCQGTLSALCHYLTITAPTFGNLFGEIRVRDRDVVDGSLLAGGAWETDFAYEADWSERRRYWYTVSRLNPYSRASWAFGIPAAAWAANSLTWSGSRARLRPW